MNLIEIRFESVAPVNLELICLGFLFFILWDRKTNTIFLLYPRSVLSNSSTDASDMLQSKVFPFFYDRNLLL